MWGDELMFQMDLEEDDTQKLEEGVDDLTTTGLTQESPKERGGQATADATVPQGETKSAAPAVGRTVSAAAEMPTRPRDDMKPATPLVLSQSQPVYIPSTEVKPEKPKASQQQAFSFMPGPPPGTKQRFRNGY